MIAVSLISRLDLTKKLALYKCRLVSRDPAGFEVWETGWGEPFTLMGDEDGRYDEWEYREILARVIAKTMPPDWNGVGS